MLQWIPLTTSVQKWPDSFNQSERWSRVWFSNTSSIYSWRPSSGSVSMLCSGWTTQSPSHLQPRGGGSNASFGCLTLPLTSLQWGFSSFVASQIPNSFTSFSYWNGNGNTCRSDVLKVVAIWTNIQFCYELSNYDCLWKINLSKRNGNLKALIAYQLTVSAYTVTSPPAQHSVQFCWSFSSPSQRINLTCALCCSSFNSSSFSTAGGCCKRSAITLYKIEVR